MVKNEFFKANPNTSQAMANAIVHAMQWLKTASIDEIIKSLPPEYYKAGEKTYRESLAKKYFRVPMGWHRIERSR